MGSSGQKIIEHMMKEINMITEIEIALASEKEPYQKILNHTQNDNHLKRQQMLAGNEHTLGLCDHRINEQRELS